MRLIVQCSSCSGTGLYSGMCEGKGRAVVCLNCNGSGAETIALLKFTGRKHYRGIKEVHFKNEDTMTYEQFLKCVPPQDVNEAQKTYAQPIKNSTSKMKKNHGGIVVNGLLYAWTYRPNNGEQEYGGILKIWKNKKIIYKSNVNGDEIITLSQIAKLITETEDLGDISMMFSI